MFHNFFRTIGLRNGEVSWLSSIALCTRLRIERLVWLSDHRIGCCSSFKKHASHVLSHASAWARSPPSSRRCHAGRLSRWPPVAPAHTPRVWLYTAVHGMCTRWARQACLLCPFPSCPPEAAAHRRITSLALHTVRRCRTTTAPIDVGCACAWACPACLVLKLAHEAKP